MVLPRYTRSVTWDQASAPSEALVSAAPTPAVAHPALVGDLRPQPARKRIAIIVGAGFSGAAGWPDTTTVMDRGAWLVSDRQAARYEHVWRAYERWRDREGRSGDLFLQAVLAGRVPEVEWSSAVEVVAGTLASVGARPSLLRSPRYADSLMQPNPFPPHHAFFAGATGVGELTCVVSLNYDLLAEKVLRPRRMSRPPTPGFHYGGIPRPQVCVGRSSSPFPRDRALEPLELTGTLPVFKPHGSLNWLRTFVDWDRTRARLTIYPDLRAAFRGRGEAAIIPPVVTETAAPSWLLDVWKGAEQALAAADEWCVAGYSLPEADVALFELLRRAASAGSVSAIYVRNRSERTRSRWEAVANGVPVVFGPPL